MVKPQVIVFAFIALQAVLAQNSPSATQATIADMIAANPSAKIQTMVEALKTVTLYEKLTGPTFTGTLLIPSDAAFANLLKALNASKAELLAEKELLKAVLQYHVSTTVVPRVEAFATIGSLPSLLPGRSLKGINLGSSLGVQGDINNAALATSDGIYGLAGSGSTITAAVYTIDTVLIPNITIAPPAPPTVTSTSYELSNATASNTTSNTTTTTTSRTDSSNATSSPSTNTSSTSARSSAALPTASSLLSTLVAAAVLLAAML